jgi:CRP-like cAMP-binding protein
MVNANFGGLLAKKLNAFLPLSKDELQHLGELHSNPIRMKRGKQLSVQEAQNGHRAYFLQEGWACSYKIRNDGGRQIISFPVPGDCVGLRSVLLQTADHYFSILTDAVVCPVEGSRVVQTLNEFPRLGAAILWAESRDEAMVVERLVSVKRRNAIERTAYFVLELAERLSLVGLATETEFKCPLSRYDLADALGLTDIHVTRVLRQLQERDLLTVRQGKVKILDLSGLRKLSGFRGGYANAQD